MSYMLLLQSILPSVVDLQYSGPFILQSTDLHASNIFVDADWNITGIIDLDFICSLPADMLCMPSWLCVDDLDDISRNRGEFAASYDSFLRIFAAAEKKQPHHSTLLADTMRQAWHSGAYWVYYSFISVNAMANFAPAIPKDLPQSLGRYTLLHTLRYARALDRFSFHTSGQQEAHVRRKMSLLNLRRWG